jgi:hypothetical protein
MNDQTYFINTPSGVAQRATREEAIEWLTGLYGPDPSAVGKIDGPEDDFADMTTADLPFALLGDTDLDDEIYDFIDAEWITNEPTTWGDALDLMRKAFPW